MKNNKSYHLSSKITKIAEIDRRYMELTAMVSNTDPNLNSVVTTADMLRKDSDSLVGMPLVVDKFALENGMTSSLTHKFDGENLNTDIIGICTEVYLTSTADNPDDITMYAKFNVFKRFPKTIEALKELFESDDLKFSWELIATDVDEIDGIAYINSGLWEGHAVVSNPAYGSECKALNLVAEAYNKDLDSINLSESNDLTDDVSNKSKCVPQEEQNQEGGESIDMKKTLKEYLAEVLTEKSIDDVRQEIQSQIRASISEEDTYVYIYDMYVSQVVYEVYSYDSGESNMYRANYSVTDDTISVDMTSSKEVVRVWMDKSDLEAQDNPMLSQGEDRKVSELEETKSELETKLSELEDKLTVLSEAESNVEDQPEENPKGETEVATSEEDETHEESPEETPTEEPETKVSEEESTSEPTEEDVSLAKTVLELSEAVKTLQAENAVLKPYRDQVIAEEKKAKEEADKAEKTRLSEMVLKNIESDEVPEEVKPFISEMDEDKVILWIAKNTSAILTSEVKDEEDDDKPIIVGTSDDEPLVKESEKFELV